MQFRRQPCNITWVINRGTADTDTSKFDAVTYEKEVTSRPHPLHLVTRQLAFAPGPLPLRQLPGYRNGLRIRRVGTSEPNSKQ